MTLVAELRASETQTILARAIDARRAASGSSFQITTPMSCQFTERDALSA
jgi:hypothetical protein